MWQSPKLLQYKIERAYETLNDVLSTKISVNTCTCGIEGLSNDESKYICENYVHPKFKMFKYEIVCYNSKLTPSLLVRTTLFTLKAKNPIA